jgi:hypothetical protein
VVPLLPLLLVAHRTLGLMLDLGLEMEGLLPIPLLLVDMYLDEMLPMVLLVLQ